MSVVPVVLDSITLQTRRCSAGTRFGIARDRCKTNRGRTPDAVHGNSSIVKIGRGIGIPLRIVQTEFKPKVVVFAQNPRAIQYSRSHNGLEVRGELWTRNAKISRSPLIFFIMVLGYVVYPRVPLSDTASASKEWASSLFVAVPFFGKANLRQLLDADPRPAGNPVSNLDVHVTQFSE
jgi:hypothetical protein